MDQELLVRQIMQEVLKNMQGSAAACECEGKVTVEDYPIVRGAQNIESYNKRKS